MKPVLPLLIFLLVASSASGKAVVEDDAVISIGYHTGTRGANLKMDVKKGGIIYLRRFDRFDRYEKTIKINERD